MLDLIERVLYHYQLYENVESFLFWISYFIFSLNQSSDNETKQSIMIYNSDTGGLKSFQFRVIACSTGSPIPECIKRMRSALLMVKSAIRNMADYSCDDSANPQVPCQVPARQLPRHGKVPRGVEDKRQGTLLNITGTVSHLVYVKSVLILTSSEKNRREKRQGKNTRKILHSRSINHAPVCRRTPDCTIDNVRLFS